MESAIELNDDTRKYIEKRINNISRFVSDKLETSSSIYFYKTSYIDLNNLSRIDDAKARLIKNRQSFLIVGNTVDLSRTVLVEFEDYIYEKYVSKQIVLLYGNCHTGIVKKYLKTSAEFNEKYEIYPLREIQEVSDPTYFDLPVFKACDVFIHQSIWKKNRYGEKFASDYVISKLPAECKVISMPNVYHLPRSLFPQYYEATELRYNNRTYFFRDKIIDEGLMLGKSVNEIADEYYRYKFDPISIQTGYCEFIDAVRYREKDWDIKVADFIDSNIKEQPMFFELNHPTNYLIKYYAENILKILLGEAYSIGEIELYKLDSYQMPMLTQVSEILGLTYSTKGGQLRNTGTKVRHVPMDIKEYVKQYYSAIWICGEFNKDITRRSKQLWLLFKMQDVFFRVYNRIFGGKITNENSSFITD